MQMEKSINEKAKTDDSPDSIVISITEAVRYEKACFTCKWRKVYLPKYKSEYFITTKSRKQANNRKG